MTTFFQAIKRSCFYGLMLTLAFLLGGCGGGGGSSGGSNNSTAQVVEASSASSAPSTVVKSSVSSAVSSALSNISAELNTYSPSKAFLNQKTTFSFQGVDLVDGLIFTLEGCTGITELAGGTSTERKFSCTPTLGGSLIGAMKLNGKSLGTFDVLVEGDDDSTGGEPTFSAFTPKDITPKIVFNVSKTIYFTLSGVNLPNYMFVESAIFQYCSEAGGAGSNTKRIFRCDLADIQDSTDRAVFIKGYPSGDTLARFVVNVENQTNFKPVQKVDSIYPLKAVAGIETTFTVNGNFTISDVSRSVNVDIDNCVNPHWISQTVNSVVTSCTPAVNGVLNGYVYRGDDQTLISKFSVMVTGEETADEFAIKSVTPSTAYLDEETAFTVTGRNFTSSNFRSSCPKYTVDSSTKATLFCKFPTLNNNEIRISKDYAARTNFLAPITVLARPKGYTSSVITNDIYTAGRIQLGEVIANNTADQVLYYKMHLQALKLYSFSYSQSQWVEKNQDMNSAYLLRNRDDFMPNATGIYFVKLLPGQTLLVKNEGVATSNPYEMNLGEPLIPELTSVPVWINSKLSGTASRQTKDYPVRTYPIITIEGRVLELEAIPNMGKSTTTHIELLSSDNKVLFNFDLKQGSSAKQKFTSPTTDINYLRMTTRGFTASDSFADQVIILRYPLDTDHDGDPDSTDPFPNDPDKYTGNTGTGGGTGLSGTWCANVSGNDNCWVFDNDTGSNSGAFYQQSINQYAGTLTNTVVWSANTSAKTLTYKFTYSELTNSASNYSEVVNFGPYTYPYTIIGNVFKFQNIDFIKK